MASFQTNTLTWRCGQNFKKISSIFFLLSFLLIFVKHFLCGQVNMSILIRSAVEPPRLLLWIKTINSNWHTHTYTHFDMHIRKYFDFNKFQCSDLIIFYYCLSCDLYRLGFQWKQDLEYIYCKQHRWDCRDILFEDFIITWTFSSLHLRKFCRNNNHNQTICTNWPSLMQFLTTHMTNMKSSYSIIASDDTFSAWW